MQFAANGKYLYSAGHDGQIRKWRISNGEYIRSIVHNGWSVSVFVVDEASDIVAFGSSDGTMNIERLSDGSGVMRLGDERVPVLATYSSPAYQMLAFGNAKGRVVVINTKDWSIVRDFNAANGPIWSVVIMPDGKSIMVAGLDDFITRWELSFRLSSSSGRVPQDVSTRPQKSAMVKSSSPANAASVIL